MAFVKLFGVVVLVSLCIQYGDCCYCMLRHPQEQFCTSDYAVLAGVLSTETMTYQNRSNEVHYSVNIKKVFKSNEKYENATDTVIISPAHQTQCAVEPLEVGINYIITGIAVDGKLYTSFCDWVKPYRNLTQAQKNGLRFKYKSGCDCKFQFCRGGTCGRTYENATCEWDMTEMFNCYTEDGICYKKGDECVWNESRKFKRCEEEVYGFHSMFN